MGSGGGFVNKPPNPPGAPPERPLAPPPDRAAAAHLYHTQQQQTTTKGTFRPERVMQIAARYNLDPKAVLDNVRDGFLGGESPAAARRRRSENAPHPPKNPPHTHSTTTNKQTNKINKQPDHVVPRLHARAPDGPADAGRRRHGRGCVARCSCALFVRVRARAWHFWRPSALCFLYCPLLHLDTHKRTLKHIHHKQTTNKQQPKHTHTHNKQTKQQPPKTKTKTEPFKMLVVDSIMANFRVDFSGRGELAERQQKLGAMLNLLKKVGLLWWLLLCCDCFCCGGCGVVLCVHATRRAVLCVRFGALPSLTRPTHKKKQKNRSPRSSTSRS